MRTTGSTGVPVATGLRSRVPGVRCQRILDGRLVHPLQDGISELLFERWIDGTTSSLFKRYNFMVVESGRFDGARNVRVFGSVARGEVDETSDIDLIVSFEPGRSLLDHADLLLELEALLGCRVDVVSDRGMKSGTAKGSL